MSIKLMTKVWDLDLPHSEQSVLLAMADHAQDDGSDCFPSVARVAWKTGYSERQVQRIIRGLTETGMLLVVGSETGGRNKPTEFRICIEKGDKKSPFEKIERVTSGAKKGDISIVKGDILSVKGDTAMSPESYNHITNSNPSVAPPRPRADVDLIFLHWQTKLNHPQAKLTPERQRKIKTALKNYSAAQLCQAIDGCAVTPHNMGVNDRDEVYDDIALILRDAAHIERFMRNADTPPKPETRRPHANGTDIEALAKRHGIEARVGESMEQYRARVIRESEMAQR